MPRFNVGDIVEDPGHYAGVITSEEDGGWIKILSYPRHTEFIGKKYPGIFFIDDIRLYKPAQTKEEKWAISKNRVESRHLRKKA